MADDKAFKRVHAWFVQAVDESLKDIPDAAQRTALKKVLWSLTDPQNPAVAPHREYLSAIHPPPARTRHERA
jgi:hypothetical protein